jgi:type IV pilus assembly protein PilN
MALGIAGLSLVGLLGSTPWAWEYKLRQDIQRINADIQELNEVDTKVNQLNVLKEQIDKQKQIQQLISSTRDPGTVLDKLKTLLPVGTLVNSLALSGDNSMIISVTVPGPIDVATLWINLRDSKMFETVDIQTVSLQDQNQTLNLSLKLK